MNGFEAAVVLTPLTFYFGYLAVVHYRGSVVSGPADWGMLGLGLSGFVFLGPLQMIVPVEALIAKGGLVWILLMLLYWLIFLLTGLMRSTRGMIYGIDSDEAQKLFQQMAAAWDSKAVVNGNTAYLPASGLNLTLTCSNKTQTAVVSVLNKRLIPAERLLFERLCAETFSRRTVRRRGWGFSVYPVIFLLSAALLIGVGITSGGEILKGILFYLLS